MAETMTPVQRVRCAMGGGTPDRVPFIPQICLPHAVRMLGMPYERTLLEVIRNPMLMNEITYRCVSDYGVDGMRAWQPAPPMDASEVDGVWYGLDPRTGRQLGRIDFEGGGGILPSEEPRLRPGENLEEVIPITSAEEIVRSGRLDGIGRIVHKAGQSCFIISTPGVFTIEYLTFSRGKQQALMDLIERPGFCHRVIERMTESAIQQALALAQVGVHGLMIADVYGGVASPRHFAEFCVPYFQRFVNAVRGKGPLIYMHVCGKSTRILELMADSGVHCIEPLDPLGGVRVCDAKRRVGRRVALMGGLDTRLLARGTLEEVRADGRRCLREGMPGGGYLLACGDMLPTETEPEKVRMLLEMARTEGAY